MVTTLKSESQTKFKTFFKKVLDFENRLDYTKVERNRRSIFGLIAYMSGSNGRKKVLKKELTSFLNDVKLKEQVE